MLSEGLWACLGALIGSSIGAITSLITTKRTIKLELKKLSIQNLLQKKMFLETVKIKFPLILSEIDLDIDDILDMGKNIYAISQYIPTQTYNDIIKKMEHIDYLNDERRNQQHSENLLFIQDEAFHLYKYINDSIDKELDKTLKELDISSK